MLVAVMLLFVIVVLRRLPVKLQTATPAAEGLFAEKPIEKR